MVNENSNKYTKSELIDRAFYRIAWNINHMWSETGCSDTRLLMEPIIPYKFVLAGKSLGGDSYKEHVVPRVMLCEEAHRMYESGSTIDAVAVMIKKYLKIVLISNEEQHHIDHVLGLKTKMPDGWSFGDGDPYARLREGKVSFELYA